MKNTLRRLKAASFVSIGLTGINVIVYIVNRLLDEYLLLAGNLNVYDVLIEGEFERILWAMFLHADVNHLFNNMIILLFMGNMLESAVGHLAFGCTYILSGICGNICSLIYKLSLDRVSVSIGASGAVFGMDGLLLALVLFSGRRKSVITPIRVGIVVFLSLYNGFMSSNIDNAAHVGGLLTGFLAGCLFCIRQYIRNKMEEKRYDR